MLKKNILYFSFAVIAAVFFYVIIYPFFHFGKAEITSWHRNELKMLGKEAAMNKEVPVASLLLYENEIIGSGKNSVLTDTNIAAHAEINAVNNAIKKTGWENFKKLNRNKLELITTFEPCPMCKGALAENHIERVIVVQEKSLLYRLKEQARLHLLEKEMKFVEDDSLQDSLFRIVPGVDVEKIKY